MPLKIAKVREFKGHTQAIYTMCEGTTSNHFFSSGADGMVVEWTVDAMDGILFAKFQFPIYCLCRAENNIFCGGNNGTLSILNINSKSILNQKNFNNSAIFDIVTFEDGYLIAQENGMITFLDFELNIKNQIQPTNTSLRKILTLKNEIYLTGSAGIIWKLNSKLQILSQILADNTTIFALAFDNKNNFLLSGGRSAQLKFWNNSQLINNVNAHWFHIKDIAFNESQQYFATGSLDKTIKLWNAVNYELLKVIDHEKYEAHRSSVNKILWIGINRFISCSDDRTIMCFEILK